jgi:GT2 family glycosyltransferase
MTEPLVSVQIVVRNGEHLIRQCLDAVRAQTYPNREVIVLDNNSTDATAHIVETEYPNAHLVRSDRNWGMWPGHERLLSHTKGSYVLAVSADVILDPHFIEQCVAACEHEPSIDAVQGKILQLPDRTRIDTCGFFMSRGRRVINVGHGEPDGPTCSHQHDIFGVEGAVPFLRRSALEDCRIDGHIWDPDYFWYGDDLDLAWRMTLLGHRQTFVPSAVAWHDRATTKGMATTPILGQLKRRSQRRQIPIEKRRLDWANVRFTIIKNDRIVDLWKDAPYIVWRECMIFGYTLLFEPGVFMAVPRFLRLLPRMLHRRRIIMHRIHS